MKQKNNLSNSNPVTKDFVKKEFKKFENKMDQRLTTLEIGTDIKMDRLERRIDDNAQKYRDQVLASNDELAKQLETMREENSIGFNQLNNKLNNHETRIKKIEHIQQSA